MFFSFLILDLPVYPVRISLNDRGPLDHVDDNVEVRFQQHHGVYAHQHQHHDQYQHFTRV